VNSDLRGVYSHGIQNLGNYLRNLKSGRIDGKAKMEVVKDSPAAVYIDAHNGMGQLASIMAMDLIIPKAKRLRHRPIRGSVTATTTRPPPTTR